MTKLDKAWAIAQIDEFLRVTERVAPRNDPGSGVVYGGSVQRGSHADAAAHAHVVEQILDRVIPGWPRSAETATQRRWTHLREWASRCRVALVREEELRERLGDGAPEMDAGRLHPWVWDAAAPLWRTGHFGQAVTQAAVRINAEVQNKLGRRDVGETDLFNQAFSLDPPKAGSPRLRLMDDDGSKTYHSVHRGARALAEGLFAGVRNVAAHEALEEIEEQLSLEELAAFSLLARWADKARVVAA